MQQILEYWNKTWNVYALYIHNFKCGTNSEFQKGPVEKCAWTEKIYQSALDIPEFCDR